MASSTISSASTCTVLFIDDDPAQLEYWSSALTNYSHHYSVLKASGEKGIELLKNQKVDCVLLDLDLPDSSGFEFLFAVNPERNRPQITVIILTHLPHPNLAQMAIHNGAQAY